MQEAERCSNAEAEEIEEDIRARSPSPLPARYLRDLAELQARLLGAANNCDVGAANNCEEHIGELSHSSAQLSAAMTDLAASLGESSIDQGIGEMQRAVRERPTSHQLTGRGGQVEELQARGFAPLAAALASGRVRFPLQTGVNDDDDHHHHHHHQPATNRPRPQRTTTAPAGLLSFSSNGSMRHPSALEVPSLSRSRSGSSDSSGSEGPSPRPDDRFAGMRTARSSGRSVAPSRRGVPQPCPGVSKWRKPPSPSEEIGSEGVMADLGAEAQRPGGHWRARNTPGAEAQRPGGHWRARSTPGTAPAMLGGH